MQIIINNREPSDKLRNTPLGELNAEYRWKGAPESSPWRSVRLGAPNLVNFSFNQLGNTWTDSDWWRVK